MGKSLLSAFGTNVRALDVCNLWYCTPAARTVSCLSRRRQHARRVPTLAQDSFCINPGAAGGRRSIIPSAAQPPAGTALSCSWQLQSISAHAVPARWYLSRLSKLPRYLLVAVLFINCILKNKINI
eukprot:SAG11_NODE_1341_length_5152_cov_3.836525_2_plen_126_part_00